MNNAAVVIPEMLGANCYARCETIALPPTATPLFMILLPMADFDSTLNIYLEGHLLYRYEETFPSNYTIANRMRTNETAIEARTQN